MPVANSATRDGAALCGEQFIRAARREIFARIAAQGRRGLTRQRQHAGAIVAIQRRLPAFGGFHRIGGTENVEVRDRAQRREMLDRLVRRPIFAKADGVVRHHMDDANAHQRRKADGGARIIGKASGTCRHTE